MLLPTALFLVCLCVAHSDAFWLMGPDDTIFEAMEKEGVKDISRALPSVKLTVKYDTGIDVNMSDILKPDQLKNEPEVYWDEYDVWTNHDQIRNYTLIFTDPDVPSRENPEGKEFIHWLVVNIPGEMPDKTLVKKGKVLVDYVGPAPPQGTGLHRYILFLFEEMAGYSDFSNIKHIDKRNIAARYRFSTADFIDERRLYIIPVAGNLFKAQYDDTIPQQQQLSNTTVPQQQQLSNATVPQQHLSNATVPQQQQISNATVKN